MNGVVASFNSHRGLGFIAVGETQYLFHCAEIVDLTREIEVGAGVIFVVVFFFKQKTAYEIIKL